MARIKSVYDGEVLEAYDVRRETAGGIDAFRAVCFRGGKWTEVLLQAHDRQTGTCNVNFVPAEVELEVQQPAIERQEPSGETAKKKRVK